ncbi:MAG: helix-turn-helix transcriptional regulator [Lachnospiraceae bacterium]|nr:helix-turn-helix transcriptional regulator [Lachnospiraceae bacterium]
MTDLKQIFAANLQTLRLSKGITQTDLGEQLNYSDKAVSKWERGESIPDASVLKQISALFGISLDSLLSDHTDETEPYWEINLEKQEQKERKHRVSVPKKELTPEEQILETKKHHRIAGVAVAGVWVAVVLAMIIVWGIEDAFTKPVWMIPVYGVAVTCLLIVIFSSLWGSYKPTLLWITVSLLVLSILAAVYLQLLPRNFWMLFLIMVPVEALLFAVFRLSILKWPFRKEDKKD